MDWLENMTTEELRAAVASAEADLDRWGWCDNGSDIGCCYRCGIYTLREMLADRLEREETARGFSEKGGDVRLLRNPVLTVERARELGIL